VDVALGFRPHTGWTVAIAVAVGGDLASPAVVERRVIELTDEDQVPAQVYHAAAALQLATAEALVRRAEAIVADVTRRKVADFVTELRSRRHTPVVAVIATSATGQGATGSSEGSNRRWRGDVAYILGAHMRMHAAEGELYGEALADALYDAGVMATLVHPRDVAAVAARGLQSDADSLQRMVTALGLPLGPPWRKDEKEATLLAWSALVERRRSTA
jgi:hypothetical protein